MFALKNTAHNNRNYAANHMWEQCNQNYAKLTFMLTYYMILINPQNLISQLLTNQNKTHIKLHSNLLQTQGVHFSA